MLLRLFLFLSLGASRGFAADECAGLRTSLDNSRTQLAELLILETELEEKYHKYVTEDFLSQVEGSLNSLSYGSAVKVAFARKRLKAAIQEKQVTLGAAQTDFCSRCSQSADRASFCERCSDHESCAAGNRIKS